MKFSTVRVRQFSKIKILLRMFARTIPYKTIFMYELLKVMCDL
jgi:hypothetical protein